MYKGKILCVFIASLVVITSGCIDKEEEIPEEDVRVNVGEMYFQQEESERPENELQAETGDKIVFYNDGSIAHTVTIPEYEFDEHLSSGEYVILEVEEPVTDTKVDCTLHENHEAQLTIAEN